MRKIVLFLSFIRVVILTEAQGPKLAWAKNYGGTSNDVAKCIAADEFTTYIYTTGTFKGTTDFDPGAGVFNLTSAGGTDIFISKTDAAGNFIWAKRIGGKEDDAGNCVTMRKNTGVFMTGYFQDTVDFDTDSTAVFNVVSAGLTDIFLLNLDTSGNFKWVKRIGGDSVDIGVSIAKMQENSVVIYLTGSFSGTVDFDPGAMVNNLKSAGGLDAFTLQLDYNGGFRWAGRMGGGLTDQGRSIVADDWSDVVYTCGSFQGSGDFDPGTGTKALTSNGEEDMFFTRQDYYGKLEWARGIGGRGSDIPYCIETDFLSYLYITGLFHDTVIFLPQDPFGHNTLISNGMSDIFIAKLSVYDGSFFGFAIGLGGIENDTGFGILGVGRGVEIYSAGTFKGVVDFDPGAGTYIMNSGNSHGAYVLGIDRDYASFLFAKARTNGASGNSIIGGDECIYMAGSFSSGVNNSDIFLNKYSWNNTGIKHYPFINAISIYPNPSMGLFNVDFSNEFDKLEIEVYNVIGDLVCKSEITNMTPTFDISNQADGFYYVKLMSGHSPIGTYKIIKY